MERGGERMEERCQFTFYRSYYEALMELPEQERYGVLYAIIAYGLDGTAPSGLTPVQKAVFILVKPTLDTGRKKASNGKQGGSKTKAKRKQTVSKGEKEVEKENEKELEIEIEDECLNAGGGFESFWKSYPVKIAKEQARKVWEELQPDICTVMAALEKWKLSKQWSREDGRFIPRAWRWLQERHFEDAPEDKRVPMGATGVLGQAELEAIRQVMEHSIE